MGRKRKKGTRRRSLRSRIYELQKLIIQKHQSQDEKSSKKCLEEILDYMADTFNIQQAELSPPTDQKVPIVPTLTERAAAARKVLRIT